MNSNMRRDVITNCCSIEVVDVCVNATLFSSAAAWVYLGLTSRNSLHPTWGSPTFSTLFWPCTTGRVSLWRSRGPPMWTLWRKRRWEKWKLEVFLLSENCGSALNHCCSSGADGRENQQRDPLQAAAALQQRCALSSSAQTPVWIVTDSVCVSVCFQESEQSRICTFDWSTPWLNRYWCWTCTSGADWNQNQGWMLVVMMMGSSAVDTFKLISKCWMSLAARQHVYVFKSLLTADNSSPSMTETCWPSGHHMTSCHLCFSPLSTRARTRTQRCAGSC